MVATFYHPKFYMKLFLYKLAKILYKGIKVIKHTPHTGSFLGYTYTC